MKCTDCKYCVLIDYGYSNWTVEGTEAECLLNKHPNFPVDHFYGEEIELKYAEKCSYFIKGEPTSIDVEVEDTFPDAYSDDDEVRELLKVRFQYFIG